MTAVAIVEEAQVDCIATVLPQGRGQAFRIAGQACTLVNGGAGVEDYFQASGRWRDSCGEALTGACRVARIRSAIAVTPGGRREIPNICGQRLR